MRPSGANCALETAAPGAWVLYRNSPVGIALRTPDGSERTARRGERSVTVVGSPEELTLPAFGRDEVVVEIEGTRWTWLASRAAGEGCHGRPT